MMSETPVETILIAEDSAPNRKILEHLLIKMGYQVLSCENGKVAWDALVNDEKPIENLVAILSDIMMPEMDGLELLRRSRGDARFRDIPFVLITAVSDREYIVEARNLNVDGYILKPVTYKRVSTKLNELFPNKQINEAV